MIWDGEKATFKGNPKHASIHCVPQKNSTIFRVMTWQREGQSLRQLKITPCNACAFNGHYCSGRCCAVPLSEFAAVENAYVKLARMTCKRNATSLADMKTCSGRECYEIEKTLPGSYVWFGVSEMNGPPTEPVRKRQFLDFWTGESVYGVHSFVVDIHEIISAYRQQIANGQAVVFRCGGTLLYAHEVCYVVIVTHEGDSVHDSLPPVTSLLVDEDNSCRCIWSLLLDKDGHCTKDGYPQFKPHFMNVDSWDHMVFAFHLPNGATLTLHRKNLIGGGGEGGPLRTEHRTCLKFRRNFSKSGEVCAEEEARCQSRVHGTDLSGIGIDDLFCSFEDIDSLADSGLQSSPEIKCRNHLTEGVAEPGQSTSQDDVVDVGNVSVEELLSSFEDADSSAEEEETESHSHLTKEGKNRNGDAVQEDVVDMGNVSVEELFSSFEDADSLAEEETESHSHLTKEGKKRTCNAVQEPFVHLTYTDYCVKEHVPFSSLEECPVVGSHHLQEGSHAPNQQSPADHNGLRALPTANAVQWMEPIGHSSPHLTRKRRHHVHYSL